MPPNTNNIAPSTAPGTAPGIALIGCGVWGVNIARNLDALGSLGAICDADPSRAARIAAEFGAPVMDSATAIADPAITAIAIATPPAGHAELAIAALGQAKAVFVEKPFALTEAEAEAMIAAAKAAKKPLMVGHLIRHHPVFVQMLAMVKDNAIGRIRHIRACRIAPGRIKESETALYDLACHDLALITALTNNTAPRHITAAGNRDRVIAGFDFGGTGGNNLTAHIEASWAHPVKHHMLSVMGDKAALVFDDTKPWEQKLALYDNYTNPTQPEYIAVPEGEPLELEMRNFIDAVNGKSEPLTGTDEALLVQQLMARIEAAVAAPALTPDKGEN